MSAEAYIVALFGGIGTPELMIILVVALLLFGPKNLPKMARSLGKSMEEFRRAARDVQTEIMREPETPPAGDQPEEPSSSATPTAPSPDLRPIPPSASGTEPPAAPKEEPPAHGSTAS